MFIRSFFAVSSIFFLSNFRHLFPTNWFLLNSFFEVPSVLTGMQRVICMKSVWRDRTRLTKTSYSESLPVQFQIFFQFFSSPSFPKVFRRLVPCSLHVWPIFFLVATLRLNVFSAQIKAIPEFAKQKLYPMYVCMYAKQKLYPIDQIYDWWWTTMSDCEVRWEEIVRKARKSLGNRKSEENLCKS